MQIFEFPPIENSGTAIVIEGKFKEAFKIYPNQFLTRNISVQVGKFKSRGDNFGAQSIEITNSGLNEITEHKYDPEKVIDPAKKIQWVLLHHWDTKLVKSYLENKVSIIVCIPNKFVECKKVLRKILQINLTHKAKSDFEAKLQKVRTDTSDYLLLQALMQKGFDPKTGVSQTVTLDDLEFGERKGVIGNGDTLTRTNSLWRNHLIIKHTYENGTQRLDIPGIGTFFRDKNDQPTFKTPGGRKVSIEMCGIGWAGVLKRAVPQHIKDTLLGNQDGKLPIPRCVVTGTTESLEIDHIEGRAGLAGFSSSDLIIFYQILSRHANQTKRNRCSLCKVYNLRCNAYTELQMPIAFTDPGGSDIWDPKVGCNGCILSNRKAFLRTMGEMLMTGDIPDEGNPIPLIDQYIKADPTPWPNEPGWDEWLKTQIDRSWD